MLPAFRARTPENSPVSAVEPACGTRMIAAGEDERLAWARCRLWRLVVPAVMGVTPLISAQFGPYLAFALMLVTHFPTPRSLRESFQQSQAAGP